jgi:hypothetical protein
MATVEPPDPTLLEQRLGITSAEARIIAEAMGPIQKIASAGDGIGSALQESPGAGPRFVGVMLQNMATTIRFTALNLETFATAVEFYIEAQTEGLQELFPPPGEVYKQVNDDLKPLADALYGRGN